MKIHMIWVGKPLEYIATGGLPSSLKELLEIELLNLNPALYAYLPFDIGGFLTFLETRIKELDDKVELYFHCYNEHLNYYQKIFDTFCQNLMNRLHNSNLNAITKENLNYQVVNIEESIQKIGLTDSDISICLDAYLNFIKDPHVYNMRHRMNFKDCFCYVLLYLYGGYVFDTNIFATQGTDRFSNESKKYIENYRIKRGVPENPKNLFTLLKTSEFSELESTIILPPENQSQNTALFFQINPFSNALCFFRMNHQIQNIAIRFNSFYDLYALRSVVNDDGILNILKFFLKNLMLSAVGFARCSKSNALLGNTPQCTQEQKNISEKINYILHWYFACGMSCAYLSAMLYNIITYLHGESQNEMDIIPQKHIANILCSTFVMLNPQIGGQTFMNFPLVKIHKNTHTIKSDYKNIDVIRAECTAINTNIVPRYRYAHPLSPFVVDNEKLFFYTNQQVGRT